MDLCVMMLWQTWQEVSSASVHLITKSAYQLYLPVFSYPLALSGKISDSKTSPGFSYWDQLSISVSWVCQRALLATVVFQSWLMNFEFTAKIRHQEVSEREKSSCKISCKVLIFRGFVSASDAFTHYIENIDLVREWMRCLLLCSSTESLKCCTDLWWKRWTDRYTIDPQSLCYWRRNKAKI